MVVVTHTPYLGGMLTSGLCVWDTQWEGRRAPIYDEWRQALLDYYKEAYGHHSPQYRAALPGPRGYSNGNFEPRVAREVIEALVARETRIRVLRNAIPQAVRTEGRRIAAVDFERLDDGGVLSVTAAGFADGSYEGDLMALAGCGYRTGREGTDEYGEPFAGRVFARWVEDPPTPEAARTGAQHDRLKLRRFPHYSALCEAPDSGQADALVQGYNWRTVVTDDPGNQLPVERPPGYDREKIAAHPDLAAFAGSPVYADGAVPNRKARLNRPQLLGEQAAYADGTWAERRRIMDAHWRMVQGFLYYLRNDNSVAQELRSRWRSWALAADEFADNDACPYEIYARETRRLEGRAVFTGRDAMLVDGLERAPVRPTSIAVTEWYIDSHSCSRETVDGSWPQDKIALAMETFPGMVPYEALLPKHLDNLLVVNCVSSSHLGWNTIRLEPTWMNIGEAAGWAFVLAKRAGVEPAAVDRPRLVRTLAAAGVMVSFFNDAAGREPWVAGVQYFGTQGFFARYDALPRAPLGRRTAEIWARAAARVRSGSAEAMETVREVQALADSGEEDPPITGAEFAQLLAARKLGRCTPPQEVTRGDACRLLFEPTVPGSA